MIEAQGDTLLRLAGPPEFTAVCVLPALADLVATGLRMQVTLDRPAEKLLAGLLEGKFDLVIATTRPDAENVAVTHLFHEEFLLVAAPEVASKVTGTGPQALEGLALIAYSEDRPGIRRFWREVFGEEPDTAPAAVVPDVRAVLALTVAGAGYTVLPRYICRKELDSGALVSLTEPATPPANTMFLATNGSGNQLVDMACRALLEAARSW